MAQKIIVTTDLSANSKAGIRFAVRYARQSGSELVFLQVVELLKPTRWSESTYNAYVREELESAGQILGRFIRNELKGADKTLKYKCVVQQGISVDRTVIAYAQNTRANFICLSTRGGGVMRKILGSNASVILTTSPVPVFVVPKNYRTASIRQILYSSDLNYLGSELRKVKEFASRLKAKIAVYHYDYLLHLPERQQQLGKLVARFKGAGVSFVIQKQNVEESLGSHLRRDVKKSKASMAVVFTRQNRGWYERLFLGSRSADLSFASTVPLLVFRKEAR